MEEIKKLEICLLKDRNVVKLRVNMVDKNRIFGYIKPANNLLGH